MTTTPETRTPELPGEWSSTEADFSASGLHKPATYYRRKNAGSGMYVEGEEGETFFHSIEALRKASEVEELPWDDEQVEEAKYCAHCVSIVAAAVEPYEVPMSPLAEWPCATVRAEAERRAAGLLGGDPTEDRVERAAQAMHAASSGFFSEASWRALAREGLAAADAATQSTPIEEPQRGARCPECFGLGGAHGSVHVRHPQGGGGWNRPCSRAAGVAPQEQVSPSPGREELASRLRGDILDAVPDDNDMQHILEMAAAALAAPPTVGRGPK